MSKTFTVAGVSTLKGAVKVRFANDMTRVKVLAKNGHKDIDLIELKNPMTKEDIVKYLVKINFANGNKNTQAALEAAAEKRGVADKPKAVAKAKAPAKKTAAPKAKTAAKVEVPAAEAVGSTETEDAPF